MATVYALMVGIERYRDTRLSRLQGCRADIADIADARDWWTTTVPLIVQPPRGTTLAG